MENVKSIVSQIQQYTDEPPEHVISQLVGLWVNWQSFVRSIVPESSEELPDRVEAIERKFNHLLLQTNQKCDETLARVAEGERNTGQGLQRIKNQFDQLFGGLSDRVAMAEIKIAEMATIEQTPEPSEETPFTTETLEKFREIKRIAPPKTKAKQIDLNALNLAQLRQLLTPNGLPQRIKPGSRYRNRGECLEVLGQLQDAGRLKS